MIARRADRAARTTLVLAGLAAVGAALIALGRGPLAAPSPSHLGTWLSRSDGVVVALTMLRLVGFALTSWAFVVVALTALAGPDSRRASRLLVAITTPAVRQAARAACGLGLASTIAIATLAAPAGADGARPTGGTRAPPTATIERAPDDPPATATITPEADAPASSGTTPSQEAPSATDHTGSGAWRVRPGDHLWSIAAATLAADLGRPPTDAEVAPYWVRVVAANPQLVDPDLILPGQVITVPPR